MLDDVDCDNLKSIKGIVSQCLQIIDLALNEGDELTLADAKMVSLPQRLTYCCHESHQDYNRKDRANSLECRFFWTRDFDPDEVEEVPYTF